MNIPGTTIAMHLKRSDYVNTFQYPVQRKWQLRVLKTCLWRCCFRISSAHEEETTTPKPGHCLISILDEANLDRSVG